MTVPGRASPPTARVIAVLEFLARHPHDRFGLSELARRVDLSKPTCLGILTTLTDAGYLVRDAGVQDLPTGSGADHTRPASPRNRCGSARPRAMNCADCRKPSAPPRPCPGSSTTASPCWNWSHRRDSRPRAGRAELPVRAAGRADVRAVGRRARSGDWLRKEPTIPLRTDTERLHRVIAECRQTGYLVERLTPGRAAAVRTDGGHVQQPARRITRAAGRIGLRYR